MALPNDCETSILREGTPPATRERNLSDDLAQAISHVASPPVLSTVAVFLAARADGEPAAFAAAAAFCILGVLAPTLALLRQWRRGEISDIEITRRDQRLWPMLVTTTCVGLAAIGLQLAGASPAVEGLASILGVQSLVLLVVTASWKISVHCAAAASVGSLLALLGGGPAAALIPIAAMIWSRLQLRRHTPAQCLGGAALGAVLVLALRPVLVI